jgi:hypothetical protein
MAAAARGGSPRVMRLVLAALVAAAWTARAAAQDARGFAVTAVQYAELRPLRTDTVPQQGAVEVAPGVFEVDGERVTCIPGIGCVRWLAAPVESAAVATQDLVLTGWGFGVEGLSATFAARARARLGGELVWPLSDDALDLTLGYAELSRGPVRARLGRQESLSGLGMTAYDGAEVVAALPRGIRIEAYGGRSLARALREPRDEALRGLQDFLPEQGAYLLGGALAYQGWSDVSAQLRYQREIWADRRGLISERASLDARSTRFAPLTVTAALDYDFGIGQVGKGQLQLRRPLLARGASGATLELTARRYLPYFELYTIWGFFSPVAYHEVEARASWTAPTTALWAGGSYRAYEDAGADAFLDAPSSSGWRALGGGQWRPRPDWIAEGQVAAEVIPGGFLSSADVSLRLRVHPSVALTIAGTGFQQIEEFRIGDGRVVGVTAAADASLTERIHLDAGAGAYRYRNATKDESFDWSQLRAWSSLRVEIGGDPGLEGAP